MKDRFFHRDLGSFVNAIFTALVFLVLFYFFGNSVMDTAIIALISIFVYPLVKIFLKALGIWKY